MNQPGTITWQDLTVPDASKIKDFYKSVAGWHVREESMGDYSDYSMIAPGTETVVAGICHARGTNAKVPPQWLLYINVEDVDASAAKCVELGGNIIDGPRAMGGGRFCIIQDPAGAVCALYRG